MRETNFLSSSDDFEYCMEIIDCLDEENDVIRKFIDEVGCLLMGYDDKNQTFDNNNWDYAMLDEILFKYIGKELYHDD